MLKFLLNIYWICVIDFTFCFYISGLGYHKDLQTRATFMEVLTKILQQGTEFDTLAEMVLADRFERLVELVSMMGDQGELPIAMALANVVPCSQWVCTNFQAVCFCCKSFWKIKNLAVSPEARWKDKLKMVDFYTEVYVQQTHLRPFTVQGQIYRKIQMENMKSD